MNLRRFVPVLSGAAVATVLTLAGTGIAAATSSGAPQPSGPAVKSVQTVTAASLCQNLWAVVNADGTIARSGCPGAITSSTASSGYQVIFPRNVRHCAYVVSVGDPGSSTIPPSGMASAEGRSANAKGVYVQTYDISNTGTAVYAHLPFHLAVHCNPPKRNGKVKIAAGNKVANVKVPGGLSSASIALATAQTNHGVFVLSATPHPATGKVTIRLNKAAPRAVWVGWSIVN